MVIMKSLCIFFLCILYVFVWFQNSGNATCSVQHSQSQMNCYSEYQSSHCRDAAAAVSEPSVAYTQTGVEQWVRQQNASRQKQQQMAASSVYAGQVYSSCDQIAESGQYRYWSEHVNHTPLSSVELARANMSSSVDLMRRCGYRNMDDSMNAHSFHHENCKIPNDNLTMEQRQQRLSKMGRLQAIQQMLIPDQQAPGPDECMDHMASASYLQGRRPPSFRWNDVAYDDDVYAGPYNSSSQVNTNTSMRHHSHAPGLAGMTSEENRWYHMQREHHMNKMGMQNSFYHCQPNDFGSGTVRYFEPRAVVHLPAEPCQLSVRDRVMPAHAMCDFTHVYPSCESQACTCEGGVSSHIGKHHLVPRGVYGYADVGMQPNYSCQQQVNRCNEFVNGRYRMLVGGSRQLSYDTSYKGPVDGLQSWNSGEDVVRRRPIAVPGRQQFDVHGQQVTLSHQLSNSYYNDGNVVPEPVSTTVSGGHEPIPTTAVRQKQPSGRKRKTNSGTAAQPVDLKSKRLDSAAASAAGSGTLMNITSASLAHLAKGVENISAVMQQTVQQGGPFRYLQAQADPAGGSDENANFIPAGNSLQIQEPDVLKVAEGKTVATSVTLPCASFHTSSVYNRCSSSTVSAPSHVYSSASTTGVDVVVMSKAPYTISYRPTGISSEGDSQGNVDVKNTSASAFSHNAGMVQHMSDVDTVLSSLRHALSSEGFHELSRQEHCGVTCRKNQSDAAKVDEQAAAAAGSCLPMSSSVAVIQPQMMSGTQLFIADRCSESASVLNNFVLPTDVPSSAGQVRSTLQCHAK